jgi:hypothetical protein
VTIPEAPTPKSGDLWVSPNGSDSNSGAKESPLKSLATAIPKLTPGQTIWMTEGTHLFTTTVIFPRSMKGTASQMYRVAGDPSGARPVLDFMGVNRSSEIRALQIDGDFWHLRNLEVQNPSDNGINVAGSNNILELLAVHDCGDTGVQISGTNSLLPSHNQVINCDSYMNADNSAENADGFAAKLDIGPGNVFYGCRSWYNVDDGWDHFEAGKNPVILENCWSFGAKHPTKSKPNSDGNGFKMGGQRREIGWYDVLPADSPIKVQFPTYEQYKTAYTAAHRLSNCFAFNNPSTGFDRNNNPSEDITCTNCGAWGNKENVSPGLKMVGELINLPSVTVEKAIAAKRDAKGNLPDIRTLQ